MTQYIYNYPMPSVTVDAVIFCFEHVLLIKRKDAPYKDHWALPGGYMNIGETLLSAVVRETKEETNLDLNEDDFQMVGVFDNPSRDDRGRVISVAYWAWASIKKAVHVKAGDDAAEYQWADVNLTLPKLAFDHEQIIRKAIIQRKS